ncbi:hypothetical protein ABIC83_002484 [Roseateles asaccharophilus]|uniref:hypothetical protein n=1 Tax=Roseateles asaccharophilus TaxID=582607 RepID=UPI0038325701
MAALKSEAESQDLKVHVAVDSDNQILTAFVGKELLPDRYISRGETLTIDAQGAELPTNFEDIVKRLRDVTESTLGAKAEEKRGIVMNHFD